MIEKSESKQEPEEREVLLTPRQRIAVVIGILPAGQKQIFVIFRSAENEKAEDTPQFFVSSSS